MHEKYVCPNVSCCKERGFDGCYECPEIENCSIGFYSNVNAGNAAKAQALFIRKHGKEAFFQVHDNLHKKYDFEKTQEILGTDINEGLKILENEYLSLGAESMNNWTVYRITGDTLRKLSE